MYPVNRGGRFAYVRLPDSGKKLENRQNRWFRGPVKPALGALRPVFGHRFSDQGGNSKRTANGGWLFLGGVVSREMGMGG